MTLTKNGHPACEQPNDCRRKLPHGSRTYRAELCLICHRAAHSRAIRRRERISRLLRKGLIVETEPQFTVADGVCTLPIKVMDEGDRALIEAFLAGKEKKSQGAHT